MNCTKYAPNTAYEIVRIKLVSIDGVGGIRYDYVMGEKLEIFRNFIRRFLWRIGRQRRSYKHMYKKAKKEKGEHVETIENIINEVDIVELLGNLTLGSQFSLVDDGPVYEGFGEIPILQTIAALCIKHPNEPSRKLTREDVNTVIESTKSFYNSYINEITFESVATLNVTVENYFVFSARLLNILTYINPNLYEFQIEDFTKSVFKDFDDYFKKEFGFTIEDVLHFQSTLIGIYSDRVKNRVDMARKYAFEHLEDWDVDVNGEIDEGATVNYLFYLIFHECRTLFIFDINDFIQYDTSIDACALGSFLGKVNCKIGDDNDLVIDLVYENPLINKPIIEVEKGKYICPVPKSLINYLPRIFDGFLEYEKGINSKVYGKYRVSKTSYAENKTRELFSNIFPVESIYGNLIYDNKGNTGEIDTMIIFDDKIFLIETKSGLVSRPALRGGVKRLRKHLKELVTDAFNQVDLAKDYITSTDKAVFNYNNNQDRIVINKAEYTNIYLIDITLEYLFSFAVRLKDIGLLGLEISDEYNWSVNLSDLEIILNHIVSPAYFIHYLESVCEAKKENTYYATDELTLFGFYLEQGNFYRPLTENGGIPDIIFLTPDWLDKFDGHYLKAEEPPALIIEPEFKDIIGDLDSERQLGYTNVTSALLDIDHPRRQDIIKGAKELIKKVKVDGKDHDFTVVLGKGDRKIGITFMTGLDIRRLQEKLDYYCLVKKYQSQTEEWIGLGNDASKNGSLVDALVYYSEPWEYNEEMESELKKLKFKEPLTNINSIEKEVKNAMNNKQL